MSNEELIKYWFESTDEDYDCMIYMKDGKKNTCACLWDI